MNMNIINNNEYAPPVDQKGDAEKFVTCSFVSDNRCKCSQVGFTEVWGFTELWLVYMWNHSCMQLHKVKMEDVYFSAANKDDILIGVSS